MFDVGFGELLVIAVLALLVLGPERLPRAVRTAGGLIRRARQSWAGVRAEVERELQAEDFKREMDACRETGDKLRESAKREGDKLRDTLDPHKPVSDDNKPSAPDQPTGNERIDT